MTDTAQAMGLVADALGLQPLRATHMDFGHMSVTYDVALPDRHVMVRANERAEVFAGTERNLAILTRLGLPVPRVLASGLSRAHYPFAYMILEKIPGRDLRDELPSMTPARMTRLAERIVLYQRTVATLPRGTGFGWVPIGEQGPFASWLDLVRADLGKSTNAAEGAVPVELVTRIRGLAEQFAPYLAQVPPTCFLDDVTTKNVIVQGGELQGLVDFDVVCYGDPLYMVGLTATAVVSDIGRRELFYVDELCRYWGLNAEQRRVVALYAAMFALEFMGRWRGHETEDWADRMLAAMEQWVALAE